MKTKQQVDDVKITYTIEISGKSDSKPLMDYLEKLENMKGLGLTKNMRIADDFMDDRFSMKDLYGIKGLGVKVTVQPELISDDEETERQPTGKNYKPDSKVVKSLTNDVMREIMDMAEQQVTAKEFCRMNGLQLSDLPKGTKPNDMITIIKKQKN